MRAGKRRLAFRAYRSLVYETDGFKTFFRQMTPLLEIAELKIGSRPASRTKSDRIEDLRAIPWVFSWAQARVMLQANAMNGSIKSLGIDRLPVEERLILVEEIWDSIAADSAAVPLTHAQQVEIQKRVEEDDAKPDDVTPWEHVKAATLARLRK